MHKNQTSRPIPRGPKIRRLWCKRLALGIMVALLTLACVELGLRVAGLCWQTDFVLDTPDRLYYIPNQQFLRQFYRGQSAMGKVLPFRVDATKPAGTTRVVILGESAAQGTPEPAFGFARILQVMLTESGLPGTYQVINAAIRGVDSGILAAAATDLVKLRPDICVLYIGNNELVGLHGADTTAIQIHLLRLRRWASRLAIGQLIARMTPGPGPDQDMAYFRRHRVAPDDPGRGQVYARLQRNLQRICGIAAQCGATVLMCTVPVNLRDCPPFGSLQRPDLDRNGLLNWGRLYEQAVRAERAGRYTQASELYEAASRIDDRFAELHFRLARSLLGQGRHEQARAHFQLACDCDALPFRADTRVNKAIRDAAAAAEPGMVRLVDVEGVFAHKTQGMPGDDLFHDHVHLSFEGDYLVASAVFEAICRSLGHGYDGVEPPSQPHCAARLAYNRFAQLQMAAGMVQTFSRPPFLDQLDHAQVQAARARQIEQQLQGLSDQELQEAAQAYRQALSRDPNDWFIHRLYAHLALWQNDLQTALQHLQAAVQLSADHLPTVLQYAGVLAQAGMGDQAIQQYNHAIKIDPGNRLAKEAMGLLRR